MPVLGLVMALPAAISGLLDYAALPPESPAEGTATACLVAAAALTLGVAGWLGGELTFRHGVGVRSDGPPPPGGCQIPSDEGSLE